MTEKTKSMTGVDAAWLHMEDPTNLMMVTGVAILDEAPDFARYRATIEERLTALDRFGMRVVEGRMPVGTPQWEVDPNFDIDAHVHHIALPAPGDKAEFQKLLSDLSSTPLDFSKPPWQMHLVENVMGGAASVIRFHHCIGDGASMNYVMYRLMDTSRTGSAAPTSEPAATTKGKRSLFGLLTSPVRGAYGLTKKTAGLLLREGKETVLHPSRLVQGAGIATDSAAVVARMLRYPPDPDTPLKGPLGVQKRVAWSDALPFNDVRLIGQTYDAKINDVLMSVVAGALRSYLQAQGVDVDGLSLRAVVPVDLRHPSKASELGNNFGLVFATLPVGLDAPLERLAAVRGKMTEIKQSPEAMVFLSLLNLFGHTPQAVEEQVVNLFGARASVVLTNVAGPRQPLYLAGSRIEHILFWVPQAAHLGLGISIFSYNGEVLIGIISDAGLIPEPDEIADRFNQDFTRLLALAQAEAV